MQLKYYLTKRSSCITIGDHLDVRWNSVFKSYKYPLLSKVAKAASSVFTRPQVEASFIVTIDIIDKRSNCMDITTYSAIIKVKFG